MPLLKKNEIHYSRNVHWQFSKSIYAVCDKQKIDFDVLTVQEKQKWLSDNVVMVIDDVIARMGSDWEGLRKYRIFFVEKDGEAILYFSRK